MVKETEPMAPDEEAAILQRVKQYRENREEIVQRTLYLLYGKLPPWLPLPKIEHAQRLIEKMMLDGFGPERIAKFVDDEIKGSLIVPGIILDSLAFLQSVNELAHIRYAVSLGEREGLKLLAGEMAVKGQSFSSAGASKKGKEYEPKASIKKICAYIESTGFDRVLEALRDADQCGDWYESTSDPIGVLFTGVDDETKTISYLRRGDSPNNQKKIKFKSLNNILANIRKTK